ncbi:hypothetical protein chiPu_0000129 [Chiloscyllium punctatum]|uniref:SH3 domain-containing protein n=1 Tax=Chiloscyllium punctatum TaxID=137246 RepID=A0A401RS39_CHIPU|nr:hypothetical protein [Chiloscyllium punctatum]
MLSTTECIFADETSMWLKIMAKTVNLCLQLQSLYKPIVKDRSIEFAQKCRDRISDIKYKEEYVKSKGKNTFVSDTPEQQCLKNASFLVSQTKYKEVVKKKKQYKQKYDAEKGKSHYSIMKEPPNVKYAMEVSKHQSGVNYKDKFNEEIKEKRHHFNPQESVYFKQLQAASALAGDREYKKEFEKSKGYYHLAIDTSEQLHRKENAILQSQKEYKKDFDEWTKGSVPVDLDMTPGYLHAKHVTSLLSEKEYRKDWEENMKGKGLTLVEGTPDMTRIKHASQILDEAMYKQVLNLGQNKYATIAGISELMHAAHVKDIYSQIKYHEDFERTRGKGFTSVSDDLVTEQARKNTQFVSDAMYKGVHPHVVEMEKGRSSIMGAAVLPGAYQQMHSPHSTGYGYMHQSSIGSVRPQQSLPHAVNMRTFRAMYDYTAADEDEVSFKDGDYIINVQAIDEGWMYGTVQRTGKTGMLPANYVESLH